MHSNQLAELAGVTVRTLRHYHQIGLLPEPGRSANGYRRYTVRHLATVLRIVSFTDLGIPLSEVREVLDDPAAAMRVLDRIDAHAEEEIERLDARRSRIARLRAADAPPDLPATLLPYADVLRPLASGRAGTGVYEREQLALIHHFTRSTGMRWLAAALENLSLRAAQHMRVMNDFLSLSDDATTEHVQAVADDLSRLIADSTPASSIPELDSRFAALLLAHQEEHFTGAQRLVWDRLLHTFDAASSSDRER